MSQGETKITTQESNYSKKLSCLHINVIFWLVSLILTVIYYFSSEVLGSFSIYYRTWIIILGEALTFFIMPVSLLTVPVTGMIVVSRIHKSKAVSIVSVIVSIVMGAVIFIYIGMGSLVYAIIRSDTIEKESFLTANIIEGVKDIPMGWGEGSSHSYKYYDAISMFLKKEHEPLSEIMEIKLGLKYNENFAALAADDNEGTAGFHMLYPKDNPDLIVHMLSGQTYYGLVDDYSQARAHHIISRNKGINKLTSVTARMEAEGILNSFVRGSIIELLSKEDAGIMAEAAAEAIREVLKDKFFEEKGHYSRLYIRCLMPDGVFMEVEIPFGNMYNGVVGNATNSTTTPTDFYTNQEHIYDAIIGCYETYQAAEPRPEYAEEDWLLEEENPDIFEPDITTPVTIEGAYKCLYEEIFEPMGDAYNNNYNAKGNFYGNLSEGKGKLNDETEEMDTSRTVVYDRISKNNLCHIFVYYETYYNKDGSEYTTAIRNTYAVSMDTGEVTASGKQAWEDTGSQAFQAAAGEP